MCFTPKTFSSAKQILQRPISKYPQIKTFLAMPACSSQSQKICRVSWLTAFLSSSSRNSVNFRPIFKNEMSKSKLASYLSKVKEILKIKQKAIVL